MATVILIDGPGNSFSFVPVIHPRDIGADLARVLKMVHRKFPLRYVKRSPFFAGKNYESRDGKVSVSVQV